MSENNKGTVPLAKLLDLKAELKTLKEEYARLKAEQSLFDVDLANVSEEDESKVVKTALLKKSREQDVREQAVIKRENEIAQKERVARARDLGQQYKVDPDELLSSEEDMEVVALRKAIENPGQLGQMAGTPAAEPIYEAGAPSVAAGTSVRTMNDQQFKEHWEAEQRKAEMAR